ncbi:MAG: hypothetical protein ACTSRK_10450, partial [Promethearchaeota archaeon]
MNNKKKIKYSIIIGLLVLFSIPLIISVNGFTSLSETSGNWRIQPGTELSYTLDTYNNSVLDTKIDEIAQEFEFAQLGENFWGEPQVELNITTMDTNVSISQLVDAFMNFTAPISIDQNLNGTWQPKTSLFLPLAVPIDMWDDFESEFENTDAFYCRFEHASYDEVIYTLGWYEGDHYIYVTFVWSDDNGSLQAIFYEIGDKNDGDTKDVLIFRLSAIKIPTDFTLFNMAPTVFSAVVAFLTIGIGGVLLVLKLRNRKQYMADFKSQISSRNEFQQRAQHGFQQEGTWETTESGSATSNFEYEARVLESFQIFKRKYLFRWVFFNGISVGIFFLGIYLLDL